MKPRLVVTVGLLPNDRGEKRELIHFVPPRAPGDEATFFFARRDEKGQPLWSRNGRLLLFNLTNNDINMVANFKIDVSKLLVKGELAF